MSSDPSQPASPSPQMSTGPRDYLAAVMPCDIVMKGGVTSGLVYPSAICELATRYRFRNIGGTSAGAIAAAVTAAAEYRRTTKNEAKGFENLASLPGQLGATPPGTKQSLLFSLFRPQKSTAAVFRTVTAILESKWPKLKVLLACLWNFPLAMFLGFARGLVLGYFAAWRPEMNIIIF
jgi:predicted acylesterase/phospholipase RssA